MLQSKLLESGLWKMTVAGNGYVVLVPVIDPEDIITDSIVGISIENGHVCLLDVIRNHMPTLNKRLTINGTDGILVGTINSRPRSDDGFLYEILQQFTSYPLEVVQFEDNILTANNLPICLPQEKKSTQLV